MQICPQGVLAQLPASRRTRLKRRGKTLIEQEYTLRRLREARALTQQELAEMTGKAQANIVRLEKQSDLLISTLRGHVEAMGGKLELRVKISGCASGPSGSFRGGP